MGVSVLKKSNSVGGSLQISPILVCIAPKFS